MTIVHSSVRSNQLHHLMRCYLTVHVLQTNEAAADGQGQDGVVGEKKKKTRRPPRNKKVFKGENGPEVVDGPNAGTEPPTIQVKIFNNFEVQYCSDLHLYFKLSFLYICNRSIR